MPQGLTQASLKNFPPRHRQARAGIPGKGKPYNVDDPDNPEEVASDTIDGTSFQFKIAEDTNYKIEVRTLGNKAKNNTEAETTMKVIVHSTTIV